MTEITLENVAADCEDRHALHGLPSVTHLRHAALCRSAQAVIEAAKSIQQLNYWSRPVTDNPCWDKLDKALAAHARNEQGTGEQP